VMVTNSAPDTAAGRFGGERWREDATIDGWGVSVTSAISKRRDFLVGGFHPTGRDRTLQ